MVVVVEEEEEDPIVAIIPGLAFIGRNI